MNKIIRTIIIILVANIFAVSCSNENFFEKKEVIFKDIMNKHDKLMEKMSTIQLLKDKLKILSEKNTEKQTEIKTYYDNLEEASDEMWNWMAKFVLPEETEDEYKIKEIIHYLQNEDKKLSYLEKKILDAINSANKYLQNNEEISIPIEHNQKDKNHE